MGRFSRVSFDFNCVANLNSKEQNITCPPFMLSIVQCRGLFRAITVKTVEVFIPTLAPASDLHFNSVEVPTPAIFCLFIAEIILRAATSRGYW